MKTTLHRLALVLCAIAMATFCREWVGGRQTNGGVSTKEPGNLANLPSGIAYLESQASFDLSDLDARDAQNNAIRSPSATQELTLLFRENLVNLTVFASPHTMVVAYRWLSSLSYLFNKLILSRRPSEIWLFQDVLLPASRRFVHNVNNLWTTFSVGVFSGSVLLSVLSQQKSSHRLPLRC